MPSVQLTYHKFLDELKMTYKNLNFDLSMIYKSDDLYKLRIVLYSLDNIQYNNKIDKLINRLENLNIIRIMSEYHTTIYTYDSYKVIEYNIEL